MPAFVLSFAGYSCLPCVVSSVPSLSSDLDLVPSSLPLLSLLFLFSSFSFPSSTSSSFFLFETSVVTWIL